MTDVDTGHTSATVCNLSNISFKLGLKTWRNP